MTAVVVVVASGARCGQFGPMQISNSDDRTSLVIRTDTLQEPAWSWRVAVSQSMREKREARSIGMCGAWASDSGSDSKRVRGLRCLTWPWRASESSHSVLPTVFPAAVWVSYVHIGAMPERSGPETAYSRVETGDCIVQYHQFVV